MIQSAIKKQCKTSHFHKFSYRKKVFSNNYATKRAKISPAVANHRKNFAIFELAGKELDEETGLYYYGARYLDPRTSRWLTGDPAIYQGDYIPVAPINDDARKHNKNLPGMDGIFNIVNMHAYHYAGNNPVKYVDPTGREVQVLGDEADSQMILTYINLISEQQYKIEDGFLQICSSSGTNRYGSKQYSEIINYLIENGTTTIQIGDTYLNENSQQIPLPTDYAGNIQAGYVYGNDTLGIMNVTVRNVNARVLLSDGTYGSRNPAEVLMHELAGHAQPRISGNVGNAIEIENSIMREIANKLPVIQHLNHWTRASDINHSTHTRR